MQAKKDIFLDNKWKRILIVVFAFLLLYLVSFLMDPDPSYWENYFQRPPLNILLEWAASLGLCLLASESSIRISKKLNDYIPWTQNPGLRLIIESALNLVAILCFDFLISLLMFYLTGEGLFLLIDADNSLEVVRWFLVSSMIALVIMSINIVNYLASNWKNEELRVTKLNQAAMEAELQFLKLQIDPHFVFNNLSILSEVILEDQQKGHEYVEKFSKIYRYMLINSKKNLIRLEEELKFLSSYIFLIEHRFGEGVHFEIDVNKEYQHLYMPPLTLQLLVENALKHNKTIKKNPLKIKIYNNDKHELIIQNTLLPIENIVDSSSIGIKNIIRRYKLLSIKEPLISKDAASFKVILTLIKQ